MSGGCDLLPVGEILELPLHRCEISVVLLPDRGSHRVNKDPVTVGDRCDDAGGNVVLCCKNTRCLEVPIIGLGIDLRYRMGVDKLVRQANSGAFLEAGSFHNYQRSDLASEV